MMSAKLQFYQSIYLKINFISIKFHNDSYCELERIFKGPITPVRFTVLRSLVNDNSGRARGEDDFFFFFLYIFWDIILISYWVKYARIWVFSDPYCLVQGPNLQFVPYTTQKIKFFIKDFFSKCDHWLYLLKKSSRDNFIFCVVLHGKTTVIKEPQYGKFYAVSCCIISQLFGVR